MTNEAAAPTAASDKHILVVDDDLPIRTIVAMALEQEGYQVVTASNGQDALNNIHRSIPDAIVLDLMMPVLDGRQLIKVLRAEAATRDIPIIVLSAAYDAASDPIVESVVVLSKPFDVSMLLLLLDDALRPDAPREEDV